MPGFRTFGNSRGVIIAVVIVVLVVLSSVVVFFHSDDEDVSAVPVDNWSNYVDTSWYPVVGSSSYDIDTAAELAGLASLVTSSNSFNGITINLKANVDLSDYYWTPIGGLPIPTVADAFTTFSGTFDGGGKTISGLTITETADDFSDLVGLFGNADGASINNLNLTGVSIVAIGQYAGGIVGKCENTTITGCSVSGSISSSSVADVADAGKYVGGIVGHAEGGTIRYCANHCDVSGVSEVGGIAGSLSSNSTVSYSYNSGIIEATSAESTQGGICGSYTIPVNEANDNFMYVFSTSTAKGIIVCNSSTGGEVLTADSANVGSLFSSRDPGGDWILDRSVLIDTYIPTYSLLIALNHGNNAGWVLDGSDPDTDPDAYPAYTTVVYDIVVIDPSDAFMEAVKFITDSSDFLFYDDAFFDGDLKNDSEYHYILLPSDSSTTLSFDSSLTLDQYVRFNEGPLMVGTSYSANLSLNQINTFEMYKISTFEGVGTDIFSAGYMSLVTGVDNPLIRNYVDYNFTVSVESGYGGTPVVYATISDVTQRLIEFDGTYTIEYTYVSDYPPGIEVLIHTDDLDPITVSVSATSGAGTTISAEPEATYGEDFTFTITQLEGYDQADVMDYLTVTGGSGVTASGNTYTISNVTDDVSIIVADLPLNTYSVTSNEAVGVKMGDLETVTHGEDYTFTVTLEEGYDQGEVSLRITGPTGAPIPYTVSGDTFTVAGENAKGPLNIIVDDAEPNRYAVTVDQGEGSEISAPSEAIYNTDLAFTAKLVEGYNQSTMVLTVTIGENTIQCSSSDDTYSIPGTSILGDISISTTDLEINKYAVSGNVSILGASTVDLSTLTVTFAGLSASVDTSGGFIFQAAEYGMSGEVRTYLNRYSQTSIPSIAKLTEDVSGLSIVLEGGALNIHYHGNGADGGTVPTDPNSPYLPGSEVTLMDNSFEYTDNVFIGWSTDSLADSPDYLPGSTFVIEHDMTFYAIWDLDTIVVNVSAATGGSTDPTGAVEVIKGHDLTITIVPGHGAVVETVIVDGVNLPKDEVLVIRDSLKYKFTNVTEAHSFSVDFSIHPVITATSIGGGYLDPEGDIILLDEENTESEVIGLIVLGTTQTFNFHLYEDDYTLESILIDGIPLNDEDLQAAIAAGSYTFVNVTEDHTFAVTYSTESPEYVTITTDPKEYNGQFDPEGPITIEKYYDFTTTVTSRSGYMISDVMVNGVHYDPFTERCLEFTISLEDIAEDTTITAEFIPVTNVYIKPYASDVYITTGSYIDVGIVFWNANSDVPVRLKLYYSDLETGENLEVSYQMLSDVTQWAAPTTTEDYESSAQFMIRVFASEFSSEGSALLTLMFVVAENPTASELDVADRVILQTSTFKVNIIADSLKGEYYGNLLGFIDTDLDNKQASLITLAIWLIITVVLGVFAAPRIVSGYRKRISDGDTSKVLSYVLYSVVLLIFIYGISQSIYVMGGSNRLLMETEMVSQACYVLIGGSLAYALMNVGFKNLIAWRDRDETIMPFLAAVIKLGTILVTLALTLNAVGMDLLYIAASLGIVTTAMSLGMKRVLAGVLEGLGLLGSMQFKKGDLLRVEDVPDLVIVQHVGFLTTRFSNWMNAEVFTMPNEELSLRTIVNLTHESRVYRVFIFVGVAYGTNLSQAKRLVYDAAMAHPEVVKDGTCPLPQVRIEDFADSAVTIRLAAYVSDAENSRIISGEIRELINDAFNKEGIVISFPQIDVHGVGRWGKKNENRTQE